MLFFLSRRVLTALLVLLLVSVLAALFLDLMPGDPASVILGEQATPDAVRRLNEQLGLDQPFLVRYLHWLVGALHGDFGTSLFGGTQVASAIWSRLPVTASLAFVSTLVAILIGCSAGILAALRPGAAVDRTVLGVSGIGVAVPHFWFALILISVFALQLKWFPATGYTPLGDSPGEWARGLVLPATAMCLATCAILARQTRSAMVGVLGRDYIRAARGRGLSPATIVFQHGLKNAFIPIITTIGLIVSDVVGATVFIESVFGMPGIGQLLITSVQNRDIPTVQGIIVVVAVGVLVVNLLVDLAYGWLNPKARTS